LLAANASRAAPRAVTVGMRPEDVQLAADGVPAIVRVVEPTGHECLIVYDLAGRSVVGRADPDTRPRPGEPVRLHLRVRNLHIFDAAGGGRLNADTQCGGPTP
jgi:multiple sugar transport system ATP-binding protein